MTQLNAVAVEVLNRPLYDLSKHKTHAKLVGQIIVTFSAAEAQFLSLFVHALRAPPWRAQAAYTAITNRNAHMDMLKKLVAEMPVIWNFKRRIRSAIEKSKTIANIRHKYAHGIWIQKDGEPYLITKVGLTLAGSQKAPVRLKDLRRDLRKIRTFEKGLAKLALEFAQQYPLSVLPNETQRAWREKHRTQ